LSSHAGLNIWQAAQWQSGNQQYSEFTRITYIHQDFISSAALKFLVLKIFFSESIFVVNITAFPINGHRSFVLSEFTSEHISERKGTAAQMEKLSALLFQSFPCSPYN